MKIWTKRAAGVSAIIGGLLVAGSVAANAADLPLVGSLPLVGGGQQQAASVDPQHIAIPQVETPKTATPKRESATHQAVMQQGAHRAYGDRDHGDGGRDHGDGGSVVVGNAAGNKTTVGTGNAAGNKTTVGTGNTNVGTGNTNVNAPVNVCGNPVNVGGLVAGAQCRNPQNNLSVSHAG